MKKVLLLSLGIALTATTSSYANGNNDGDFASGTIDLESYTQCMKTKTEEECAKEARESSRV